MGISRVPAFSGANLIGAGGGHVQVTAYGSANRRCQIGLWSVTAIDVFCFDLAGNPADSQYSVLFLRPSPQSEGLAFARANQLFSVSPYTPDPVYSFNAAGGPISAIRTSLGTYRVTIDDFETQGSGGGHVQVTAYGVSFDRRCMSHGHTANEVLVRCFDSAGNQVDSTFNVLSLRPIALPEPGIASGLAAAALGLAFVQRRIAFVRSRRG